MTVSSVLQDVLFTHCMHLQLLMYSQINTSRSMSDIIESAAPLLM